MAAIPSSRSTEQMTKLPSTPVDHAKEPVNEAIQTINELAPKLEKTPETVQWQ